MISHTRCFAISGCAYALIRIPTVIQFQVECIHCSSVDEVSNHLRKMTRVLAEQPNKNRGISELECISKLKPECSDLDPDYERAMDCWIRQLQQIPRISRPIALNLACHHATARSLWNVYQQPDMDVEEKRYWTADMFSERSTQAKLASHLYTVLTSTDPDEILR